MSRFCLDTSAYSHFRRGVAEVVALMDAADWIGVPAVVLAELRIGFLLGRNPERNESELRDFLANPAVETLSVDGDVARIFAEIFVELRRLGQPLPVNDIWIAACAADEGATVLTFDRHFEAVPRIATRLLRMTDAGP